MNNKTTSYSESIVDVSKVSVKWYTDVACTTPAKDKDNNDVTDLSQLSNDNKHPTENIKYYIKVTYDAGKPSAESNQNTTIGDKIYIAGEAQGEDENIQYTKSATGIYTVNVISGEIQITKKLVDEAGNQFTEVNPQTFKFKVTKLQQNESGTIENDEAGNPLLDTTFGDASSDGTGKTGSVVVTVTVPKNSSEESLTGNQLKNLPRGIYEVEEVETSADYEIDSAKVDTAKTDCYATEDTQNKKVRFSLGYKLNENNVVNVIDASYKHTGGGQKGVTTYTNKLVTEELDLKKVDEKTNNSLDNAVFKLYKKNQIGETFAEIKEVTISNKEGDPKELTGLLPGVVYKLTETKAPNNHALLGSSIYFKVESGKVLLTDENGKVLENEDGTPSNNGPSEMWTLDEDGQVLTIKNTEIYSLPSSGGPGIYGFTISGVAFITAALLLFINNKRKEDNIAG